MPQLGERLKKARVAKGLTLEALAGETCTAAHVHKVEAGQVCPSPAVLKHLCTALELPLHEVASDYFGLCRNPGYVLSMCETLRAEGKAEVSLPVLEALAGDRDRRPAKPEVLLELGKAYACLGRMAEAEGTLIRAASQANAASRWPIVGEILFELGMVFCRSGKPLRAIEAFAQAVAESSSHEALRLRVLAEFSLAGRLLRAGLPDAAVTAYQHTVSSPLPGVRWLDGTPVRPLAWMGLGVAHYLRLDYEDALLANKEAVGISPQLRPWSVPQGRDSGSTPSCRLEQSGGVPAGARRMRAGGTGFAEGHPPVGEGFFSAPARPVCPCVHRAGPDPDHGRPYQGRAAVGRTGAEAGGGSG